MRVLALDQGQSASVPVMIVIVALMFQRHVAQIPCQDQGTSFLSRAYNGVNKVDKFGMNL